MRIQFSSSSMGMGMDIETYTLEINSNGHTQRHNLQTFPPMAAQQFQNLVVQAARSSAPCLIKITRQEEFWSELDQKFNNHVVGLEFRNNAYGNRD